jgi:two-component system LytT family response regulator
MTDPLRVLIVDDERLARHHLRKLLGEISGVECAGESPNGESALAALRVSPVDVILLDVQMPGLDGFEVLKRIPADTMPAVIFVTAFDHYAVKAFDVHATDYLLKPPDPERLRVALDSARLRLKSHAFAAEQKRLRALVEQLSRRSAGITEVVARDRGRALRIPVTEIDWVEAEDNYVRVHADGRSHLIRGTIAAFERDLDPNLFIRIHRSAIVNVSKARELRHSLRGGYSLILGNGEKLKVSRAHRKRVRELFRNGGQLPAATGRGPLAPT